MIQVVIPSVRGHAVLTLRTSDDTVDLEEFNAACAKVGTTQYAFVVLPDGKHLGCDFVREGQEPGRVGVAV